MNGQRLSRVLIALATGLTLVAVGSLSSRTLHPLPSTQVGPVTLAVTYLILVGTAVLCGWGSQRITARISKRPLSPTSTNYAVGTPPDPLSANDPHGPLPEAEARDPFTRRIIEVIGADTFVAANPREIVDGECQLFAIRARKAGLFAQEPVRKKMYTDVTLSIGGHWTMTADTVTDALIFRRKAGFPKNLTPPIPTHIARSPADALSIYPQHRIQLGVTATSDVVGVDPSNFPHMVIVGGTGSGKSVYNRGLIEAFRAAGWMIVLCDGKGTDYEGLHGQPNIVAISQSTPDHVRTVRMVAAELHGRQADAKRRKRRGEPNPFQRPPMLLLLDEYATMKNQIQARYGNEGLAEFQNDLLFITRVGREFKVHVALSTQELYRNTLPGALLGNMPLIASLGPPADKTIKEAFPDALKAEAGRIGGTISKNDRGRGIALFSGDDGRSEVIEFQSYFAYSPGESKPASTQALATSWQQYKEQVSDTIPKMYPRVWWAVQNPDYDLNDDGEVDISTLYSIPVVALDGPDGRPDPAMSRYDPLDDSYLGAEDAAAGAIIHALGEMPFQPDTPTDAFRKIGADDIEELDQRRLSDDIPIDEVTDNTANGVDAPAEDDVATERLTPPVRRRNIGVR